MLHMLNIENFYSIFNPQCVDLRIAANVPDTPGRFAPLCEGSKERAPKVIAIFGPNASGKSTVLRALSFIAWFVRDSFSLQPDAPLPFGRFNNRTGRSQPARLSLSLAGPVDPTDLSEDARQCRYSYEIELGGPPDQPESVEREALFYWPPPAQRKVRLFERGGECQVTAGSAFALTGFRQALDTVLRPNASVISTLAQLKHPFATSIWEAAQTVFSNIFIERSDVREEQMVRVYARDPHLVEALNHEIERIDFGIREMRIKQQANGPIALFTHEGHDRPMPLLLESQGTRLFLRHYPILVRALETGGIAVMDELDTAIHPLILPEILRWFHDPKRNPKNAQLWMTCHNASLLAELAKEEVIFTEKGPDGRSEIFALGDIRAVRRDDNYYRKYMSGSYGAVPNIG